MPLRTRACGSCVHPVRGVPGTAGRVGPTIPQVGRLAAPGFGTGLLVECNQHTVVHGEQLGPDDGKLPERVGQGALDDGSSRLRIPYDRVVWTLIANPGEVPAISGGLLCGQGGRFVVGWDRRVVLAWVG